MKDAYDGARSQPSCVSPLSTLFGGRLCLHNHIYMYAASLHLTLAETSLTMIPHLLAREIR